MYFENASLERKNCKKLSRNLQKRNLRLILYSNGPKNQINEPYQIFFDDEVRQLLINENELPPDAGINRHPSPVDFYKLYVTDELIESIL